MAETANTEAEKRFTPDEVIARQRNRQLMIITAVIVALALLVVVSRATTGGETAVLTLPLVGGTVEELAFEREDVMSIEIWKEAGSKLELKRDGEQWRVPTRFNAPASGGAIDSLLTKLFDSRRLNQPATAQQSSYALYRLNDEDATHLQLLGEGGDVLLHLLVGSSDTGTRTFVRILGQAAPEGIFEVTGLAGRFDSLHGMLNLTPDGAPDPKQWLDLSAFDALPFSAVAQRITIRDGERRLTFQRKAGSDPAGDEWQMTHPHSAQANGANVRSVVDVLMNLNATDIAGPLHPDGASLGVNNAEREIEIEYTDGADSATSRIYFGRQEDSRVAVLLKATNVGELVYWCPDYSVSRLFRPTGEFLNQQRVRLVPDGVQARRLTIFSEGTATALQNDDGKGWRLNEPFTGPASPSLVNDLLASLNGLQGYTTEVPPERREEAGLVPGYSQRWIDAAWSIEAAPEQPSEEGEETENGEEDNTEGESADDKPSMTSARLYFGKSVAGEVPVLRVQPGEDDKVFWIGENRTLELFVGPRDLQDTETVGALRFDDQPVRYTIRKGSTSTEIVKQAEGWQLAGDTPVKADPEPLLHALRGLTGISHGNASEHVQFNAGPETAARSVEVLFGEGEDAARADLWFGDAAHGYVAVFTRRTGEPDKLHWVAHSQVDKVFADSADYRVIEPFEAKVRQVLVTWKGRNSRVQPKQPDRTREEALKLVEDIIRQARTGTDFVELQRKHNEDSVADTVYDVTPTSGFVKPFTRLASELEVGEVGHCESEFGFHVLKRVE